MRRLLLTDDIDAALQAGLMRYVPCPACDRAHASLLIETQQRLLKVWAARDRYLARQARLARRVAERDTRRAAPPGKKSALPPAAAAILARAKARAAERGKP